MLDALKRWIATAPKGREWRAMADWARQHGADLKRARHDQGFVIDGALDGKSWRLEWGPPQRSYIEGQELRMRMALGLPQERQMLLLSRPLMETLERQTFEHYTANMQTQIDASSPEEMRWLVMFPKVPLAADKDFRNRFGVVASSPMHATSWIDGALADRLLRAGAGPLAADPPFVLMTLRGRLYLRLQLAEPEVATVAAMVALFEVAAAQAVSLPDGKGAGQEVWPSTSSTAWQSQLQPEDPLDHSRG